MAMVWPGLAWLGDSTVKPFNRILKPNFDANVKPFKHLNQPKSISLAHHLANSIAHSSKLEKWKARKMGALWNVVVQLFCLTLSKQCLAGWQTVKISISMVINRHSQKSNEFRV